MLRAVLLLAMILYAPAGFADTRDQAVPVHLALGHATVLPGSAAIPDDLAGRVIVVAFFASWCPPCKDEFAHLNALAVEFADRDVQVLAVNVYENWGGRDNPQRMQRFLEQTQPVFPLVRGSANARAVFGGIDRIPTVIVFDRSGREIWRFVHARGADKTHATLTEMRAAVHTAITNGS